MVIVCFVFLRVQLKELEGFELHEDFGKSEDAACPDWGMDPVCVWRKIKLIYMGNENRY